ncbi:MAG: AAA family ATPase [bacterium]|nr:AAA family ATPase [bacterium]
MAVPDPPRQSLRRQATVVYADISGFTALSERLDPEEVTAVMNQVFEILEGIVIAHGGTVNKYIGDCVLAVFGLAAPDPAAPAHAVQAALEMRAAIHHYNLNAGAGAPPLDIHMGIETGLVVAGEIGGAHRREFAVMGDTVALAARLEDVSAKGDICVGPATWEATRDAFHYRATEPLVPRAGTAPVAVHALLSAKPRAGRVKRDSERRQATVLFADLVGFDALVPHLSPQNLTQLLNRCFGLMEEIVRRYGGVVDKYIGECVMALFGVPNAIENAPQQAVNAAIEMRSRLEAFGRAQGLPTPLGVHMGINTGLVIAGEIGGRVKRDFTVMGDTVNLASRLKDAAPTGVVHVGPETYRWTKDTFAFDPPQPMTLAGKAQRVPVRALASVRGQVHRTQVAVADRTVSSPLVGRDDERRRLEGCLARALAGDGGIVSVVGEAGVGKSRLVAEVLRWEPLAAATVLEGRSTSIGQTLSFHPFIDLLRRWAGVGDDDAETAAGAKLAHAVGTLLPDEADEVLPFVATLMGMRLRGAHAERLHGIDGEALEKLIFRNVRRLFQALAATRPLVLVFEDLHWADRSSVQLLEALLRLVVDQPVLFVHVFRPDYADTAERILRSALDAHAARHTEVRIEPLGAADASRLVQNLLEIEDLPAATRALITHKAEGNPFYLEEVVRALIDQGAVEYADGGYRVTARIERVVIPGTIQEVVMARVDRLDEPTRRLLQVASVIGRQFYYRIIAEIMRRRGGSDATLDAELARLQDKQLLLRRGGSFGVAVGGGGVAQELEFVFKHALAQETVYDSLLQKTRREFHQLVADSIEASFAERLGDFYGMLAYHYSRADDLPKAEEFLFKAGDVAARSAASSEALQLFREASRIYLVIHGDGGDPARKALLEKNIGYALLNTGKLTESIGHFDRALEHMGSGLAQGATARYARFARDMTAVLYGVFVPPRRGRRPPVSARERETFEIMFRRFRALTTSDPQRMFVDNIGAIRRMNRRDPRSIETACLTYVMGGAAFAYSGTSFAIGRRFLRRAEELVRPGEVADELGCGFLRFVINFLEGGWEREPGLAADLLAQGLRYGIFWDVNSYLGLESDRQLRRGRFAAAREHLRALADMHEQYGYEFAQANHDGMQAILLLEERRLDEALPAIDHYYAGRDEDALRALALGTRAKIQSLQGAHDEAGATLARVDVIVARAGLVPPWHMSASTVARLRHDCDALAHDAASRVLRERARAGLRRALRVAGVVAPARTETWRLAGRLHWLLGRRRAARAWWTRALREGERLGAVPELARTCAEVALRTGDGRDRARSLFAEAGLVWDAAQLDRALASPDDPAAPGRL